MLSRFSSRVCRQIRSYSTSYEGEESSLFTPIIWGVGLFSGSAVGAYKAFEEMNKEKDESVKYVYAVAYPAVYGAVGLGLAIFYPIVVSGTIVYCAYKAGEFIDKKREELKARQL